MPSFWQLLHLLTRVESDQLDSRQTPFMVMLASNGFHHTVPSETRNGGNRITKIDPEARTILEVDREWYYSCCIL